MDFYLEKDEKLEPLEINNCYIIQSKNLYRFSLDSVMLADFCKVKHSDKVLELCSGSGVISFLISLQFIPKEIVGMEICPKMFSMAQRTKIYNKLQNISFINDDILNYSKYFKAQSFDVIVSNPPYYVMPQDTSKIDNKNLTTKYEKCITMEQIFLVASKLLKNKGIFYVVYPSNRLQEIMSCASKFNLFCKKIKFANVNKKTSTLALLKFVKNGNFGVQEIEF